MKKEARRYLKCQTMGSNHLAVECDQPSICGTCGKEHQTADCTKGKQDRYWCVNCKSHIHAPWDHTCPKFIKSSRRLKQLNPESTYIYYPTDKPWTWEQSRNPASNRWANNDTEMRNTRIWAPTGQEIYQGKSRNDRRTPNERQGYLPQTHTNRPLHEQAAPPTRQEPKRGFRYEPSDAEQQDFPGRQRRIDEFLPAPNKQIRQRETKPP